MRLKGLGRLTVAVVCLLIAGCSVVESISGDDKKQLAFEQMLSQPYDETAIKTGLTLDVLPRIEQHRDRLGPEFDGTELISRGDNVVVLLGQSKDGYQTWFNMLTFHEYVLNVVRKYFFLVDDRAGRFGLGSRKGLRFDCEMVLPEEILKENYPNENAKRITILRLALGNLREDIGEIDIEEEQESGQNSRKLDVCGMLMNQAFEMVQLKLDSSPSLAGQLDKPEGVEFDHISFGTGRVRMFILEDVARIKILLGTFADSVQDNQ